MRILFASSEVMPFSRTGGLADVSNALPTVLAGRGHEVIIITPRYGNVDIGTFGLRRRRCRLIIPVKQRAVQGGLLEGTNPEGVPILFVDQPAYFERGELYGINGKDFPDNDERFAFFSRAVLETCHLVGFSPDIIHCNDWQTGPVPALLQFDYRDRPELNSTGTVFTVHNLAHQGLFPPEAMMALGLGWNLFTPSTLELLGKVSFIKAGLVFADKLTTVSRRHAEEIKTPAFGFGLEGMFTERAADLKGILNGVDYRIWDPRHDRFIAANFDHPNLAGKVICKADLQQRVGLPQKPDVPLVGWISRITALKDFDLFLEVSKELVDLHGQWVFLGAGDREVEEALTGLAGRHPDKFAVYIGTNEELVHRIQAGADILFMPSLYEPCGLTQIQGLRYGTIPVVRAVGGLDDTVDDVSEGEGNGFKFTGASSKELLAAMLRAFELFKNKEAWHRLVKNAMCQDFSWELPSRQYENVYKKVLALRAS